MNFEINFWRKMVGQNDSSSESSKPIRIGFRFPASAETGNSFKNENKGGSPGLVVMGGILCTKGCEFESVY